MRVLVCGGRDFNDRELMRCALAVWATDASLIIHGGAPGADSLASDWAFDYGVPSQSFPADWKAHGKAAGPLRNQRMIDDGKPDLVVAFPGGRGTADMVRRAEAAGVPVKRVDPARAALEPAEGETKE